MGFSEELAKNRKRANLTQEELAEKCGVSRQAVAKWEKGESLPDIYMVAKLAKLFSCSIEDLIWSKGVAVTENKEYCIRPMTGKDREVLRPVLRQLRYMDPLLAELDEHVTDPRVNDKSGWEFAGSEQFAICEKTSGTVLGYLAMGIPDKGAPSLTIQISRPELFAESACGLIRDFLNDVVVERGIRAINTLVHGETERRIFESFGYTNVGNELIITTPI